MHRTSLTLLISIALASAAALAAEGDLDPTFDSDGKQTVAFDAAAYAFGATMAADGKIYLVGAATTDAPTGASMAVARLHPDGAPDESYNGDGDADGKVEHNPFQGEMTLSAAALQPDGKLVVAGRAAVDTFPEVDYDMVVCRLMDTGALDEDFGQAGTPGCRAIDFELGSSGHDYGSSLVIQDDGKIVIAGGSFDGGSVRPVLARVDANGALDTGGFGTNGKLVLEESPPSADLAAVGITSQGQIIAAGTAFLSQEDTDFIVFRVNANGTQDMTYNEGFVQILFDLGDDGHRRDVASSLKVLDDDSVIIAGSAQHIGSTQMAVAKIDVDGVLDDSFNGSGLLSPVFCDVCLDAEARAVAIQADGSVVLVGPVVSTVAADFGVLRVSETGEIDTTFGIDGRVTIDFGLLESDPADTANAVFIQGGKVVVTGSANAPGDDNSVFAVSRLKSDLIFKNGYELDDL